VGRGIALLNRHNHGTVFPEFQCGFWFNRKRHWTEIAIKQLTNVHGQPTKGPVGKSRVRRYRYLLLQGALTVRIHETDAVAEHALNFEAEGEVSGQEFPCHSRLRKNRRKRNGQNEGEDKGKEDAEIPRLDFYMLVLTKCRSDTPLMWLRFDPDMELLRRIHFRQSERMWVMQLEKDRDVIAQHEVAS
jgi:transcription initiation factor TFIID subunit 2